MGIEVSSGIDTVIDEASNITGSDVGWADKITEVAEKMHSDVNNFGTAASRNVGITDGNIPELESNGKLHVNRIPSTDTGGSAGAGLIARLNASGLLNPNMIPASSGGASGGIKHIWYYTRTDSAGNAGSELNRQYTYLWRPRDSSNATVDITSILVILTGGGGSGAPGPLATVNGVSGQQARKGGGGGAGSTVIAIRTGITSASRYHLKVGFGGDIRQANASPTSVNNGTKSEFDTMDAGGGLAGNSSGAGGLTTAGGVGDALFGFYIPGGSGHDGTYDIYGGGSGGASFWGGGHNGGDGLSDTRLVAWGSGAGAAHGSRANGTFVPSTPGKEGQDGIVVVIGW